jgi:biopolymer transport protein ExbD
MGADLSSSSEEMGPISAINVTPFVDVVLVLLVIFMVTAPVLTKEVLDVNLPKASSGEQRTLHSLGIAITQQGQILLNGQLTTVNALTEEIKREVASQPETQAIISADGEAKHSDVVRVIDIIKTAGLSRFALQVQHPE